MEHERIKELTSKWESTTWKIIDFQDIDRSKLQQLFKETYELLDAYLLEDIVPKEICSLLLEMHDFGWWVSDLEHTPIHCHYQEIINLINKLTINFLTHDASIQEINNIIENF